MSCTLSIIGENLDVDRFIDESKFKPYKVSYKGQPKFKTRPNGEKLEYSFLSIQISKEQSSELKIQIDEDIEFIRHNKDKLNFILNTREIQFTTLSSGIELNTHESSFTCNFFPPEFIKLCSEYSLSIELCVYPIEFKVS